MRARVLRDAAIRILAGRPFGASDVEGGLPVAIVDEPFARRFFAGRPVVGQRLSAKVGGKPRELTIVGLAASTRAKGLREDAPETVYLPYAQLPDIAVASLLIRGDGPVGALARAIEPALRAALPGQPIEIQPLATQVGATIVQERVLATLAAGFGLLALVLTIVGLYGVMAYEVAQRTQELGVRLALGARREQVVGLVLGDGARLVALGIAVGLPAAWLASRWVRTLLFGVTPADPVSAFAAIVLMAAPRSSPPTCRHAGPRHRSARRAAPRVMGARSPRAVVLISAGSSSTGTRGISIARSSAAIPRRWSTSSRTSARRRGTTGRTPAGRSPRAAPSWFASSPMPSRSSKPGARGSTRRWAARLPGRWRSSPRCASAACRSTP